MADKIKPQGKLVATYGNYQVFLRDDGKFMVTGHPDSFINISDASHFAAGMDQIQQRMVKLKEDNSLQNQYTQMKAINKLNKGNPIGDIAQLIAEDMEDNGVIEVFAKTLSKSNALQAHNALIKYCEEHPDKD